MGVIVDCFHGHGIKCVFKSNWKNLLKKWTKLVRAYFHNTAPQTIGPRGFLGLIREKHLVTSLPTSVIVLELIA